MKCSGLATAIFATFFCLADVSFAQAPVRLKAQPKQVFSGRNIRILQLDEDSDRFKSVTDEIRFGRNGVCQFQLESGTYRFEVFDASKNDLICVRTERIEVANAPVDLSLPISAMTVELKKGDQTIPLTRIGVRSLVSAGNVFREMDRGKPNVKLYATPGSELDIVFAGFNEQDTILGTNRVIAADSLLLNIDGDDWKSCSFEPHPDNPKLTKADAKLDFPLGSMQIHFENGCLLTTNFSSLQYQYRLRSKTGLQIVSRKAILGIQDGRTFLVGGKLKAEANYELLWRDNGDRRLHQEVTLNDPVGQEIDIKKSTIKLATRNLFNGSRPPKVTLNKDQLALLRNPAECLKSQAAWEWVGQHEMDLQPRRWVRFDSARFTLEAPAGWEGRANVYLSVLEATSRAIKTNTGKKGPQMTEIHWRSNTHNAKARVGGDLSWMSMPINGLYKSTDPGRQPWFISHEMLHTFGYNHGKKMDAEVSLAERKFHRVKFDADFNAAEDVFDHPLTESDLTARSKVKIIDAKFGSGDKWADITDVVKTVWNSRSQVLICNLRQFRTGDPAPGTSKKVRIQYEKDGESRSASFGEYWVVNLGEKLE